MQANSEPRSTRRLSCSTSATATPVEAEQVPSLGTTAAPIERASSSRSINPSPLYRTSRGRALGRRRCGRGNHPPGSTGLGGRDRGDMELTHGIFDDVGRDRCRHLASRYPFPRGFVDDHQHGQSRALIVADDGRETGRVVPVVSGMAPLVETDVALVARLPGRSRLAGYLVAVDGGGPARARLHDGVQHPLERGGSGTADHPGVLNGVGLVDDDARRHPVPAVRDGVVRLRHLQGSDSDALAHGHVGQRQPVPAVQGGPGCRELRP